jgi:aminoglycoside phosphotransferase (APT) family kinase protein
MDVHLKAAIAQTIMRRHRPSCVVEGLELLHGGNISTVYEIRCAKPDQPVILKIYPDTFHWKMEKEVYVYQLLGRAPALPTPSILWSDNSKELLPQNYMVMTRLKGQLLSQVTSSLLALELRDIYFEMGALLAKVHGITLDAFGYITTRITAPHPTNDAYMRSQFQKKLVEFDAHGGDVPLPVFWTRAGDIAIASPPSIVDSDATERSRFVGHAAIAAARAATGV